MSYIKVYLPVYSSRSKGNHEVSTLQENGQLNRHHPTNEKLRGKISNGLRSNGKRGAQESHCITVPCYRNLSQVSRCKFIPANWGKFLIIISDVSVVKQNRLSCCIISYQDGKTCNCWTRYIQIHLLRLACIYSVLDICYAKCKLLK